MKKSLLLILASLFAIFALTGCAEDSKNDTPAPTPPPTVVPIDPATNPEALMNLVGNYEITFFHTNGGGALSISSDCTKVAYYTGSADEKCVQGTNSVEMKGYGEVSLSNDHKYINITTKMQMTNDKFKNPGAEDILWNVGKSSQYNYTVYTPIPVTAIANGAVNDGENAVTGTTGRDLEKNVSSPTDTYKFELLSDGSIRNTMKNMSGTAQLVGGADVTVIMRKIDALPEGYTMDANTQFPEPVIEGFVADPSGTTGGGNEENPGGEGEGNEPSLMDIIGAYSINSLSLNGLDNSEQLQQTDYTRINTNGDNLMLALKLMGMMDIFVYSENPAVLMESGLTVNGDEVGFVLPGETPDVNFAEITMTKTTSYDAISTGIGSMQEEISLNINNGENITSETTSFDVVVTHAPSESNKYYSISVYSDLGILPTGSYVGLPMLSGDTAKLFTASPADCATRDSVTTCKVTVSGLTQADTETPYIVVVNETDAAGTNPTGVSSIGLVKLSAAQAQ